MIGLLAATAIAQTAAPRPTANERQRDVVPQQEVERLGAAGGHHRRLVPVGDALQVVQAVQAGEAAGQQVVGGLVLLVVAQQLNLGHELDARIARIALGQAAQQHSDSRDAERVE